MRIGERNNTVVGLVGVVVVALVLTLALNSGAIYRSATSHTYQAAFPEAGGLKPGDQVQVAGFTVGQVGSVDLDVANRRVSVKFTVDSDVELGQLTRAAIKTQTPLGRKYLHLAPAGHGELEPGGEIPLRRTNSPYDIAEVLSDLTTTTRQVNTEKLRQALDTVATTFQDTPKPLAAALSGVERLSAVVASRDRALRNLLSNSNKLTGVLAERTEQVAALINDGNALLTELHRRRAAIRALLVNTTHLVEQLRGAVEDNQAHIGRALDELEGVLNVLNKHDKKIAQAIHGLRAFATSLGEAVGGGPFFYIYLANLVPTNLAPMLPELLQKGSK